MRKLNQRNRNQISILDSKKGNAVLDTITYIIVIVVFSIIAILGYIIFGDLNDDIQNDNTMSQIAKDKSQETYERTDDLMDNALIFLLVLLWGASLVFAYFIDSKPIFFIFTILLLIFVIVATVFIANAVEELTEDEEIGATIDSFPKISFVLDNILQIVISIGFTIALVLFAKSRQNDT